MPGAPSSETLSFPNENVALRALTLASWDHDRVMALHDGRVTVPGITLRSVIAPI